MPLVDVHCHLSHQEYENQLDKIISRAKDAKLGAIVVSGVNPFSNRKVLELSTKYPIIKASLGLYPIDLLGLVESEAESGLGRETKAFDIDAELEFIKTHKNQVVSIGEIGMDFKWATKEETLERQAENFRKCIRAAVEINKAIVIHSRKAEAECIDILEQELYDSQNKTLKIPVVMHCFSGKKKLIIRGAELGLHFTVPAVAKKLQHFHMLASLVPLKQLLTETDAPWLTPYNEGKNEPSFVTESISVIAAIKKISEQDAIDAIWENYKRVFEQA